MRRPLLYPIIALVAGILIGDWIVLPCFLLLAGALAVLLILLLCVRKNWNIPAFILILALTFITGLFNIQRQQ